MSEKPSSLEKLSDFLGGLTKATISLMRIHPMVALLMVQLYGHIGYIMLLPNGKDIMIGGTKRESRQEALAEAFFHMNEKCDLLLTAEVAKAILPSVARLAETVRKGFT